MMSELVLSLFPGIGLLDRGFEQAGFAVVRGPDLIWGGDVRRFHVPAGKFDGVFGGPPCQEFSQAKNGQERSDYGLEMLGEFERVVLEAEPIWWLMENVARVPDVKIAGYNWQRLDVWAHEFGVNQRRLRHFQFGSRDGTVLVLPRPSVAGKGGGSETAVITASDTDTPWDRFCVEQGLPCDFDIPAFTAGAKRRAVGNGVPVPMAAAVAAAVAGRVPAGSVRLCECSCGRPVKGKKVYAGVTCRVRSHRRGLLS